MTILQYETRVSPEGLISLPPIPELHNRKVVVSVEAERTEDAGKSIEDFINYFTSGPMSDVSDEEIEKAKEEYLMEKFG